MAHLSKRQKEIASKVDKARAYSLEEAVTLLQSLSKVKFKEALDVAVRLGIDPKRSDQSVRGSVVLPNGTGKTKKIALFTSSKEMADQARAEGAHLAGDDEIISAIEKGEFTFDVLLTTPSDMPKLAKYGQALGPRGLMPNPKTGTVGPDAMGMLQNAKKGQVIFRADRYGIVHARVGAVDFSASAILENVKTLIEELKVLKPSSQKGIYLRQINLSTTMGPGLRLDPSSLAI